MQVDPNLPGSLHQQILFVERQITEQTQSHDLVAVQLLCTIPGIGKTLAFTTLYEVGDIGRFPSVGTSVSYARPRQKPRRSRRCVAVALGPVWR